MGEVILFRIVDRGFEIEVCPPRGTQRLKNESGEKTVKLTWLFTDDNAETSFVRMSKRRKRETEKDLRVSIAVGDCPLRCI